MASIRIRAWWRETETSSTHTAAFWSRPIGITDCLNFGNPEKPEVMPTLLRDGDSVRLGSVALVFRRYEAGVSTETVSRQ